MKSPVFPEYNTICRFVSFRFIFRKVTHPFEHRFTARADLSMVAAELIISVLGPHDDAHVDPIFFIVLTAPKPRKIVAIQARKGKLGAEVHWRLVAVELRSALMGHQEVATLVLLGS